MIFAASMLAGLSLLGRVPCTDTGSSGCIVTAVVGRAELRLLVDTGADVTMLTAEAARRAGFRPEPKGPITPVQGVGGDSWAHLTRMNVQVGASQEPEVMVAVSPDLRLGRLDGLLGMSFLERFRFTRDSESIELTGIDEGEDKRGGRGRSWWSLRFRQNKGRLAHYEAVLPRAKKFDRELASWAGVSADEPSVSEFLTRLRDFMLAEKSALEVEAARHSVPHEWRR